MNQKEYELIASVFFLQMVQLSSVKQADLWRDMVYNMAVALDINYPKTFDEDKFLKACGVK